MTVRSRHGPRYAVGLALLVLSLGACGRVTAPGADDAVPAAGPTTGATTGTATVFPPSKEAHVVCEAGSTNVVTPVVIAQPDGVHILVENREPVHLGFAYEGSEGSEAGGDNADRGESRHVKTLAPGEVRVRCLPPAPDTGSTEEWATFQVIDPRRLWVPHELDCNFSGGSDGGYYAEPPKGDPRDPVEIAREDLAAKPGDEVKVAGYPEAVPRLVILVRDGRTIGLAEYQPASFAGGPKGSGWILDGYESC